MRIFLKQIGTGLGLIAGAGLGYAGETLPAREAFEKATQASLLLVDVRTEQEWKETGMPDPAIGVTLQAPDFIEQVLVAANGDLSRPVAVICRSGNRSSRAMIRLEEAGFERVFNVTEGVLGRPGTGLGWLEHGLPLRVQDDLTPSENATERRGPGRAPD